MVSLSITSVESLLITGSRGKMGKILVASLSGKLEIHGVDIAGKDHREYRADISDTTQVDAVFEEISRTGGKIDFIIHLAADASPRATWDSVLKNNIVGTRNIYEWARRYGVQKVVFASSNHVTGGYEGIPPKMHEQQDPPLITVNHPIRPDSDYGSSKAWGEAIARQYWELYGIRSICLRIGTVLEDNMPQNARHLRTWLSHRDLVQLVTKSIYSNIDFGIYYGVSNNKGRFWDISNARKEIGYRPDDDASEYAHLIKF